MVKLLRLKVKTEDISTDREVSFVVSRSKVLVKSALGSSSFPHFLSILRVSKNSTLVSILSQINQARSLTSYFLTLLYQSEHCLQIYT